MLEKPKQWLHLHGLFPEGILHSRSSQSLIISVSLSQLATSLVAQVKTFDRQTLVALGQQAMGLTTGQISNLTPQDLVDPQVLESLGQVNGWNRGQSQGLVNKILRSDFTVSNLTPVSGG